MTQLSYNERELIVEYDELLMHVKQAQAAAQHLGDSAATALLEALHRLCITRVHAPDKPQATQSEHRAAQPTPPVSLTIYLLGQFQLLVNGTPIHGWRKKSEAVLKYLIMHRSTRIHRDKLLDLFWPHSDLQAARNCLNVTLHSLRRTLEPATATQPNSGLIQFTDDHYHLHPGLNIWTDVDMFVAQADHARATLQHRDQANAIAQYELAAALYRGDFLEQDRYEEWTIAPRERLRSLHLSILGRLSVLHFEAGNYLLAIDRSQQILERDSCCEDAHCLIMRSYHALGQRGLALRQYTFSRNILANELDVAPMEATTRLYEQIKADDRDPAN
jgi:DNA-binding SARP family transcriptional activator